MLALPVMGSQFGQIMVNQVDAIMIGHLGSLELAAAALGNAVFISAMIFGFGITTAISPLVSEAMGKKNRQDVSSYLKHGLVISLLIGIILAGLVISITPFLSDMNQPEEVVILAVPYIEIIALSLIPLMVFFALRQFGEGLFETKPGMIATISGNVVNIGFNFLLIYGMFGFPKLGIVGAGYGTLIAQTFMLLLLLFLYFQKDHMRHFIKNIQWKAYNKTRFKKMLSLGIPSAFQGLFEVVAFGMAAFIAGMIGVDALAAHQIAISLAAMTFLMCMGFSVATTVRIGNQLGEKDFIGLRRVGVSSIFMVIGFMLICGIVFILFNKKLPWIYVNEIQVIEIAASLLVVAAFFQISDGVQVVLLGALRGMQDVNIPTLITFISYWILALPISYWLGIQTHFGAVGIWVGLLVGLTTSATLLFWRFHFKTKTLIKNMA